MQKKTVSLLSNKPKHVLLSLIILLSSTGSALALNSQEIDQHWNYAMPASSEQQFAHLASQHENDLPLYLEILTQKARAQGLQDHFAQAHETLDLVLQANQPVRPLIQIRYLLERGRVLNSSGHPNESTPFFKSALDEAQEHDLDFFAIDAAHMLGIVSSSREQAYWTETAIELAEASTQKRCKNWLGSLYNNLGWTHFERQDYDKALNMFQKNVDWYQKQHKKGLQEIIAQWSVARTHRAMGNHQQALEQQQYLLAEITRRKLGEDGYIYEEIAENLLSLGKSEAAHIYFSKAWQLLSQDSWMQKHEVKRLERLKLLSRPKPHKSEERNQCVSTKWP